MAAAPVDVFGHAESPPASSSATALMRLHQLDDDAVLQISSAACAAQGLFILLAPQAALEFYYPPVCVDWVCFQAAALQCRLPVGAPAVPRAASPARLLCWWSRRCCPGHWPMRGWTCRLAGHALYPRTSSLDWVFLGPGGDPGPGRCKVGWQPGASHCPAPAACAVSKPCPCGSRL